jgi:ABC transport system ATP-binding/permease protein
MNVFSADNVSKTYSERWLFKEISFGLNQGDKVALVGVNGAGKSTLLKIIAGLVESDSGQIKINKDIKYAYLPQEPNFEGEVTIEQVILQEDNEVAKTAKAYERAILDPDVDADVMQDLLNKMDQYNAWEYETNVAQILGKLGLSDLSVKCNTLSGGQKKRVALAKLLLSNPDFIILDEPTNHLDLDAIEWLENRLNGHNTTLMMITHDRYFLDNVANEVFELNDGKLYRHKGNYAYFLEKKAERELSNQASIDKAKNLLTKELEWMRRMPKARGTKAKYRIDAFYEIKDKASQDTSKDDVEINIGASRLGNKIIELKNVNKAYNGRPFIKDFTYTFKKFEKLGIVGKNGVGKSTFLNILTGKEKADSGEIDLGTTLNIGYYTQHSDALNLDNRIIDEVREIAEYVTLGNGDTVSVSKLLEMFLFPPAVQYTPIHKLSGGEKRRLLLLKVLVKSPNFLILDEPTNDLDIDTLNVLEQFLESFSGCLILVSHDRYFMDKLVDQLFIFEGDGYIKPYNGNYSDYRNEVDEKDSKQNSKKSATKDTQTAPVVLEASKAEKKKLSFKEQKELDTLEAEMAKLELEKKKFEELLNTNTASHQDLINWAESIGKINTQIDDKTLRWMELSE